MFSKFSLPKRFAIVGATIFFIAAGALTYFNLTTSIGQMKQMAEENNAALTFALANALWEDFTPFFATASTLRAEELVDNPKTALLHEEVIRSTGGTRVAKVKIYNSEGLTIFSTDATQIGEDKSVNDGFLTAIGGGVASALTYRNQFDAFEKTLFSRDLLSSYIPVGVGSTQQGFSGVFEIYSDVTEFKAQIVNRVVTELVVMLLAFVAIYVLLLYTVIMGSRMLAREHQNNLKLTANIARVESASRAKSEFLATMSHELRTPLNAIIGFSELIKNEVFGVVSQPQYKEFVNDIHASGNHLLGVIDDVLDLAKIESEAIKLRKADVSLASLISESAQMLQTQASEADVALDVEVAEDLPVLHTDTQRLKQILVNLVSNAVKFTPAGGRVTVQARWNAMAGEADITVTDTGIGMDPSEIPISLAPFGQIDSSLSRKYEGTGLGLPLSKKFAELLGGKLQIMSEPGEGTVVKITLPIDSRIEPRVSATIAA